VGTEETSLVVFGLRSPAARVKTLSTKGPLPAATPNPTIFDVADYASKGMFNPATPDRVLITADGIYSIEAVASPIGGAGSERILSVVQNGLVTIGNDTIPSPVVSPYLSLKVAVKYKLHKGDFIQHVTSGDDAYSLAFAADWTAVMTVTYEREIP
jgi:hypothetical protein